MRIYAATWAVILVPALLLGCSQESGQSSSAGEGSKRLLIHRVDTELRAVDGKGKRVTLDIDLRKTVEARIAESDSLALAAKGGGSKTKGPRARLRVAARVLPDGFTGKLHALVSARIFKTGSIPITADIDAVRPGAPDGGMLDEKAYVAHLEKALADAVKALDEQAGLLSSGNKSLIKALEHAEDDIRMAAVRTLGERGAKEAVRPICNLLKRERGRVGQAGVGALVMIGDDRGVPCMIQWAGSDDRRLLLILDPLGTVGGSEAEAFLDMIASGHDDAHMRRVAERSLERLGTKNRLKNPDS